MVDETLIVHHSAVNLIPSSHASLHLSSVHLCSLLLHYKQLVAIKYSSEIHRLIIYYLVEYLGTYSDSSSEILAELMVCTILARDWNRQSYCQPPIVFHHPYRRQEHKIYRHTLACIYPTPSKHRHRWSSNHDSSHCISTSDTQ
jgi:hypothetical protein